MPPDLRAREAAWARAASRWLPVVRSGSPWRFSGPAPATLPAQGWKLHVTSSILSAVEVLEAAGPLLRARGALAKGPATLADLKRLNCGLFVGYSQIGKFLTVYPASDDEACALARDLDAATRGLPGPAVPFEQAVAPSSSVYTRYGAFGGRGAAGDEPGGAGALRAPDGAVSDDRRDRNPSWAVAPPGLVRGALPGPRPGPLATTFRAYEAIAQRGKGGVYRGLDLSVRPPRHCVIKEGRAAGEVDWDGSDGRARLAREGEVLADLGAAGVPVAQVYARFEEGGHLYLVLERIEGDPLGDFLAAGEPPGLHEALDLATQCASLLERIHARGWVWRDMKAANLMLSGGRLRPLDFEGAAPAGAGITSPWGSPGHLPPEWRAARRATLAQDRYALGALLHHLLTGILPGSSDGLAPLADARPEAPPALEGLIAALTRPEPRRRPPAAAARRRLEAMPAA
jgi:hypothetical protein